MNFSRIKTYAFYLFFFLVGCHFLFVPLLYHDSIPGDLGDSRYVNIHLEHIHRYLFTSWPTEFWNAPWMMFPTINNLAFSDIIAGTVPLYSPFRLVGFDPQKSFQLWYLVNAALNFYCMILLLRSLNIGAIGACAGAFLFAFSLPRGSLINHPQLYQHFFSPLLLWCLVKYFISSGSSRSWYLYAAAILFSLQLWAAFYLGWFLCFGFLVVAFVLALDRWKIGLAAQRLSQNKLALLGAIVLGGVTLWPLAKHYTQVKQLVGPRPWHEAEGMLPCLAGYLSAVPTSFLYPFTSSPAVINLGGIGNYFEQRMFMGFIAFPCLPLFAIWISQKKAKDLSSVVFGPALLRHSLWVLMVLVLLSYKFSNGSSLWHLVFDFVPGANAIRAVSRIVVLLFIPLAVIIGIVLTYLEKRFISIGPMVALFLLSAIVMENSHIADAAFTVADHKERVQRVLNPLRQTPAPCQVFYFQRTGLNYEVQLDAMWASIEASIPTVNGYSGNYPPDWRFSDTTLHSFSEVKAWLLRHGKYFKDHEICLVKSPD